MSDMSDLIERLRAERAVFSIARTGAGGHTVTVHDASPSGIRDHLHFRADGSAFERRYCFCWEK